MNTMRVFLHDLLWQQDSAGFQKRIDQFLTIASHHHIRPMLVLFDSCWDPAPQLGPQHPPIPGVHNSGWVQSPGAKALGDPSQVPRLKAYVQGVVGAFAKDDRILGWDVWNEPGSYGGGDYAGTELERSVKIARVDSTAAAGFHMGPRGESVAAAHQRRLGHRRTPKDENAPDEIRAHPAARVRRYHLSQLQLARVLQGRDRLAQTIPSAADLHGVHGPPGREHLRRNPADCEGRKRRRHQLGIRSREDANLSIPGSHGSIPTCSTNLQCGSTKSCAPTAHRTVKPKRT